MKLKQVKAWNKSGRYFVVEGVGLDDIDPPSKHFLKLVEENPQLLTGGQSVRDFFRVARRRYVSKK